MPRLSRGRAALVAGLYLAGSAVSACDVNLGDSGFNVGMASGRASDTWTRSYTVSAGGRVEIINTNGTIEVSQGTGPAVEVTAERIAKATTDAAAKDLLAKIEIVETAKPDSVRLETKTPRTFGPGGAEVKYTLKIPVGLHVRTQSTNGRITLTKIANDVEATTTNGGVRGEGLTGTVQASTTNGGVELTVARLAAGGLRAETTNGGVAVELPSDSKADISAHVTNGGIGVENLTVVATGEKNRRHLEGKLNGGGPLVELSTTNGGIRLAGK
jgi:Toastrack DUF4097